MSTEFNFTDPTYLRTIYGGLLSGSLHKDNASSLPVGPVGIYEEALPPASHVKERQLFLEFFSVWALLKKEVSAEFVSQLLGWTEERVLDYIALYSKWFNAPLTGKYVLYHERFRSFVLQKISHAQFATCNEAIIYLGKRALEMQNGDEWEQYALEHLSTHLLIQAMESKNATALKTLAYSNIHWNRQVEISNGFEWSKRMLNDMMLWASKYDDDEVIECALNKVDLYHQEQNDAPRIMALVSQNDMDTALQRIESFGGNDKDGLQRKFTLYMLCLMDLTLLKSKDKPHKKERIEKLLKHLDDNIPVDHSILNWNDFFSSYLMFQMACEWACMGFNYNIVYDRTSDWEKDWISVFGPYSDAQLDLLLKIAPEPIRKTKISFDVDSSRLKERVLIDDTENSRVYGAISVELARQGKLDEALALARGILNEPEKCCALVTISSELVNQSRIEEAELIMQEASAIAAGIIDNSDKSASLRLIASAMASQGKFEEAMDCARGIQKEVYKCSALQAISAELAKQGQLEKALECNQDINDENYYKSKSLQSISTELAKRGQFEDALICARSIIVRFYKIGALVEVSGELLLKGEFKEAELIMQEASAIATVTIDIAEKSGRRHEASDSIRSISSAMARQGKFEEAIQYAKGFPLERSSALQTISDQMSKQSKFKEAAIAMQATLEFVNYLDEENVDEVLTLVSAKLSENGKIKEAIACARGMISDISKINALLILCGVLVETSEFEEAQSLLYESIECATGINDEWDKSSAWECIANELTKQGKFEEALECLSNISVESYKNSALQPILNEWAKQGQLEKALLYARSMSDVDHKIGALAAISTELVQQGQFDVAKSAIKESLECAKGITHWFTQTLIFKFISDELTKQGNFDEAVECAGLIPNESDKCDALCSISCEMAKLGRFEEALTFARSISDVNWKCNSLSAISSLMSEQIQLDGALLVMQEALKIARNIDDESEKSSALKEISNELYKQGKFNEAASIIDESIKCALGIIDESEKSEVLKDICTVIAENGNLEFAEQVSEGIPLITERHNCWKTIAGNTFKESGWRVALQQLNYFQNPEVKTCFLKGLADLVNVVESDNELILNTRIYCQNDIVTMSKLLRQHALHELFFQETSSEKIKRYNRTLDIQWALDIKNSFYDKL
jgi:tetratricopeptide (TPR) repeat protein